jgi:NAD(P)H-flavin reductase
VGSVTEVFRRAEIEPDRSVAMLCGPEGMMRAAVHHLLGCGVDASSIWLSMERSMHCAIGRCGHCQFGPKFVCRDGPGFCYTDVQAYLDHPGF